MDKIKLEVWGYRCERCDHEWVPRLDSPPRLCPKCKSAYWDVPRRQSRTRGEPTGAE
jgi:predicted Zn-ribbon and HTH transcriptional regulator